MKKTHRQSIVVFICVRYGLGVQIVGEIEDGVARKQICSAHVKTVSVESVDFICVRTM